MPVRKAITEKEGVYFITFTCTNWLLFLPQRFLKEQYRAGRLRL